MSNNSSFQRHILDFYHKHGRCMPWRETTNPYHILISEIMLQQTQTSRVLLKYPQFLKHFPDFATLAYAPFSQVLRIWHGLGYNRRAGYLQQTASLILQHHNGQLPSDRVALNKLPGIGANTAGALQAFAFNIAAVFIETNIRRVFIHHFFHDSPTIDDKQLLPLIDETLDRNNPRQWYWALMDYGAMLARTIPNPNRRSRHYHRQPKFHNSNRQLRGAVLRLLLEQSTIIDTDLPAKIGFEAQRVTIALEQLEQEGFIVREGNSLQLDWRSHTRP